MILEFVFKELYIFRVTRSDTFTLIVRIRWSENIK